MCHIDFFSIPEPGGAHQQQKWDRWGIAACPPWAGGREGKKQKFSTAGRDISWSHVVTLVSRCVTPCSGKLLFFSFPPSCSGGTGCNPSPIPFLPLKALPISILMLNYLGTIYIDVCHSNRVDCWVGEIEFSRLGAFTSYIVEMLKLI